MKRVCSVVVAAGLLFAGAAEAQSLADVAKQEQERRKALKEPARVYTEADVQKMAPLTTAVARPQPEAAATTTADGGAATADKASATGGAGATDAKAGKAEAPKDEAGWQARVQQTREELARSRRLLTAMEAQLLIVGVQNATARSTGQATPDASREQESVKEVERLRAEVEKHTAALAQIESEARAAGIPPGWVR
jgi:hypothetical protein